MLKKRPADRTSGPPPKKPKQIDPPLRSLNRRTENTTKVLDDHSHGMYDIRAPLANFARNFNTLLANPGQSAANFEEPNEHDQCWSKFGQIGQHIGRLRCPTLAPDFGRLPGYPPPNLLHKFPSLALGSKVIRPSHLNPAPSRSRTTHVMASTAANPTTCRTPPLRPGGGLSLREERSGKTRGDSTANISPRPL